MIDSDLFLSRRNKLMELMKPNSVAVIPTNPVHNYSNDTDYRFRPNSDFYYLTGFREPDAVAIISTVDGAKPFTMFVRPRDPLMETWNGRRAGTAGAVEIYGADEAFEFDELEKKFSTYFESVDAIYHFPGQNNWFDREVLKAWNQTR